MSRIIPKQLIIEPTNRCQLSCRYCPKTENENYPVGDMPLDMFKAIIDTAVKELPDTVIIPWMNGEPMLHPEYFSMVVYLIRNHRRFYVTTNMMNPNWDALDLMITNPMCSYQIIVSYDGYPGSGNAAKARPGTDENKVLENILTLVDMKKMSGSQTDIALKICERGQDWEEIENFIQWGLENVGVDYVCVGKPLVNVNPEQMRRYPCQYFDNNFMIIRWNGTLPICAYNDAVGNEEENNYGRYHVGDSLIELYNNETISKLREDQNRHIYHGPCRFCSFAYTGQGFRGEVNFRKDPRQKYFYQQDYYNSFFSKVKKWKA